MEQDEPGRDEDTSGDGDVAVDGDVSVLVADDHPMWREAVARDLTDAGYRVVATAGTGAEAVRRARATRPSVAVLDLQMPDGDGVQATREVVAAVPGVRVLVLSASGEHQDVLEAVKAGATGYLVKSATREQLVQAVASTAAGQPVFTPGLAGMVLGEFRRMAADPVRDGAGSAHGGGSDQSGPATALTPRETQVLRLVAKGLAYRQIAERLGVSHRTVQNHVQNVLGKLHLSNRVELTRWAIASGLDDPGADRPATGG